MRSWCRLSLVIAGVLIVAASSGCTTREFVVKTVGPEKIAEFGQYEDGLNAFFRVGHTVTIHTREEIAIGSARVDTVKMVIRDLSQGAIRGRIVSACCDPDSHKIETLKGQVVEISPGAIASVQVWDKRFHHDYPWLSATGIVLIGLALIYFALESCGLSCFDLP